MSKQEIHILLAGPEKGQKYGNKLVSTKSNESATVSHQG